MLIQTVSHYDNAAAACFQTGFLGHTVSADSAAGHQYQTAFRCQMTGLTGNSFVFRTELPGTYHSDGGVF